MYTTKRVGNNGRTYVGANINNRQFEVKVPQVKKIVKSVIQAPGKMISRAVKIESDNAKRKDDYYRANAPVGAYGGTNTGAVKFPSNVKIKK